MDLKTMLLAVVVVGLACQLFPKGAAQASSAIYTPKAKGEKVVKDTVSKINGLGIFPKDERFLCRIAWVESEYGNLKETYRNGYHGGIWQVDKVAYLETVNKHTRKMKRYRSQIKAKLGIDWSKTKWEDLWKPLYSGLAARLYLVRIPDPIPKALDKQVKYWKDHYNLHHPNAKGTPQKFIKDVNRAKGCGN